MRRYEPLLPREHGVIIKKCRGCLRVALLYPSLYEAAVASLAYQMLYYMLNSMDFVVAERFVLPRLEPLGEPLRSLETNTLLKHFDAVIIPVSYELDIVWALHALIKSGINPRNDKRPLIIIGGPAPSMNPAPYVDIADVIVVGEIEPTIPKLMETLYTGKLEDLGGKDGFLTKHVIESNERAHRVYAVNLDESFHPTLEFRVPGSREPWGEAYMVEVSRGCWRMCRFCMEAYFTMPWRYRSLDTVKRLVREGVERNKVKRVALYSLSFFDYPNADKLLEWLEEEGLEATIGSLRADTLNEDRLLMLKRLGQRTVTIAPETLIERLGRALNKLIDYSLVKQLVELCSKYKLKPKLYMMTGIPCETIHDVETQAQKLQELTRTAPDLRVTLNPLIPKPNTPTQWLPLITEKEYMTRVRVYRRLLGERVEPLSYRWALAQAVIARGSRELGKTLFRAAENPRLGPLLRLLKDAPDYKRTLQGYKLDEELPWETLTDPGYPMKTLEKNYEDMIDKACIKTE